MRGVTLEELTKWVKKHKQHTWDFDNMDPDKKRSLKIKYLEFSLDTRDMQVWCVSTNGMGEEELCVRDDNEGDVKTILDGLEEALKLNKVTK